MQEKTGRHEQVDALWPQVKALPYPALKVMRDAISNEMQAQSLAARQELRERLAVAGEDYGLTIEDVIGKPKRRGSNSEVAAIATYQNPEKPGEIWNGSSRKPKWLIARLDAGEDLERFRVPAEPQQE